MFYGFANGQPIYYLMGMARVKLWSIFSVTTIFNLLKIVNLYHLGLQIVNYTINFPHTIAHTPTHI